MKLWPFARKSAVTGDVSAVLQALGAGRATASGRPVTQASAIRQSVVFGCCRVIAEGVAQVPCKLYRKSAGRREEALDHPLFRLLHRQPNHLQTSFEFRETLMWNLALHGNAYALKIRDSSGQMLEILPLASQDVECTVAADWARRYVWRPSGGAAVVLPVSDVWHLRGPSLTGAVGLSAVTEAREAIGLADAMETHSASMFGNGARPSGLLTTQSTGGKPEQVEALREMWQRQFSGSDKTGKTVILTGGWAWTPMDMNSVDAQLIEQRRFEIEEICRFFRVNPVMVMSGDRTQSYASVEQLFLGHVVHTLMPWYERFQQSAEINLLTPAEQADGYMIKLNEQGLLRGALRDQAEYWSRLAGIGVLSANEVRELNDLNPYPGGEDYRVALNTAPASAQEANLGT